MKEREKMVKIGTKVVINYGAGIPEDYGVITDHKNDGVSDYAVITGDDFTMTAHTINHRWSDEKSVNGSSIGVWTI